MELGARLPAGSSQADSARFIDENVIFYERLIPQTNYGVNIGTDYVKTISFHNLMEQVLHTVILKMYQI